MKYQQFKGNNKNLQILIFLFNKHKKQYNYFKETGMVKNSKKYIVYTLTESKVMSTIAEEMLIIAKEMPVIADKC